jgi:hypothetical protein
MWMWAGWQINTGQHENSPLDGHAVHLDPLPGHGILHEQPGHRLVPTAHLGPPTDLDPLGEAGHGGHLGPLTGSWKACMAPCEDTCSSVSSLCSA